MKRPVRPACGSSKLPVKDRTSVPPKIVLDNTEAEEPFATFSEWANTADERAYRDL